MDVVFPQATAFSSFCWPWTKGTFEAGEQGQGSNRHPSGLGVENCHQKLLGDAMAL